jgi:heat shock protein HtpX
VSAGEGSLPENPRPAEAVAPVAGADPARGAPSGARGGARNLWEEQARNRRQTALLVTAFVVLLVLLGLGVDYFLWMRGVTALEEGAGAFVPVAAPIALAVGLAQTLGGYYLGAKAVLGSTRARAANPADPNEAMLLNVVQEMRLASGLPMPGVYVVPDSDPNAFAVGRSPEHASIAVTQGLLDNLSREELQGVVAHEMAHVRNLDIRTMTLVAALLGALVLLSDLSLRMLRFGGAGSGRRSSRDKGGGGGALVLVFFVLWVVLAVATPVVAQMMAFAVSRSRELDADASAAEFTRNPIGLAKALRKIDAAAEPTRSVKRGSAHLCIADPLARKANASEGRVASLFATHPPMEKRIAILESMAGVASA